MEYRTVTTLKAKREEILSAIAAYERHLDQARRRLFRRNELRKHCMDALEG